MKKLFYSLSADETDTFSNVLSLLKIRKTIKLLWVKSCCTAAGPRYKFVSVQWQVQALQVSLNLSL